MVQISTNGFLVLNPLHALSHAGILHLWVVLFAEAKIESDSEVFVNLVSNLVALLKHGREDEI